MHLKLVTVHTANARGLQSGTLENAEKLGTFVGAAECDGESGRWAEHRASDAMSVLGGATSPRESDAGVLTAWSSERTALGDGVCKEAVE